MERFLAIPLMPGVGGAVYVTGLLLSATGVFVWLICTEWKMVLGANLVYLGVIVLVLGRETRARPARLPLTPLAVLFGWFLLRRAVSLTQILDLREALGGLGRRGTVDFFTCSAQAELIGALGLLGFWSGWRLARQGREVSRPVPLLFPPTDWSLWGAYGIGLLVYLLSFVMPALVGRLGNFGAMLGMFPSGVAFCVAAFSVSGSPLLAGAKSVGLMLPFTAHVMGFGMKSAFLQPVLPAFHALLLKNLRIPLLFAFMMMAFLLLFVYPYIGVFRAEVWGANRVVTEKELAQEAWKTVQQIGYGEAIAHSFEKFQERYSSIGTPGWIVEIVKDEGHLGPVFLQNLRYAFIPRLLWPNKPRFESSGWLTLKLAGIATTLTYEDLVSGENVSSTAFHLPMEWYWMLGWGGAFFGMAVTGFGYAWLHRFFLIKSSSNAIFLAGWFLFLMMASGLEEIRSTTTIQRPIIILAASWTMYGLTRFLPSGKLFFMRPSRVPSSREGAG